MYGLRWIFLAACFGSVVITVWNGRWEGRLSSRYNTFIIDLGRAPVWAPPPVPPHARFREVFKDLEVFPAQGTPGLTIQRVLKWDWMVVDLLLYLWLVTAASGLLYLALRGERRDRILHLGLWAGFGLTAGATACFGLWLMLGGWGPPDPEFFGGLGLVMGIIVGLWTFTRGRAEQIAVANPPRE